MFPCCCNNQPPPGLVQCAGQVFRISSSLPSSCPWIHQKRRASASRNDPALPSNNAHAENVYELRTENIARVRGVMALFPTATGERFASRWTWRSKSLGPTYVTRLLLGLLSRPLKIIRPRNNHIHLLRFGSPPASILAGPPPPAVHNRRGQPKTIQYIRLAAPAGRSLGSRRTPFAFFHRGGRIAASFASFVGWDNSNLINTLSPMFHLAC
jgi:hypothetical protein